MNRERLLEVKAQILAEPEHFDMGDWVCGTTCCIGGRAALLARLVKPVKKTPGWDTTRAGHALDLDDEELFAHALDLSGAEAVRLFYANDWPPVFACAYDLLRDANGDIAPDKRQEAARIAADRIDLFLDTDGRE